MKLDWLKPLVGRSGPFATVHLDASRTDVRAERELRDRWQGLRRELVAQGAQAVLLDALDEVVTEPTGTPGHHGRVVVASADGVLLDTVLPHAPARDEAVLGAQPALLSAVLSAEAAVPHLLVEVDRSGADLTWSGRVGGTGVHGASGRSVDGGHDELRKHPSGGPSQRRYQARAEDSWERNADAVAAEVDRVVAECHPEAVLLTGDVRATALVRERVGAVARPLLVDLAGGSRADGVNEEVFRSRVADALEVVRVRRREEVLDRYRTERGRAGAAVTQLGDVVDALRRAQVAELVVDESVVGPGSALSETELWVGDDPLQLALTQEELVTLGVAPSSQRRVRAGTALVEAALGSDSGLTFADAGAVDLVDGIGAILRYEDPSTPDEQLLTMQQDTRRQGRRHAVER